MTSDFFAGLMAYRPPTKCLPLKWLTNGLGAVRLIRFSGLNFAPGPESGGPFSILHEEGASTAVTGTLLFSRAVMTAANGSLTSPEKLKPEKSQYISESDGQIIHKPKIESTTWSVFFNAPSKSSVNGTPRFFNCSDKR